VSKRKELSSLFDVAAQIQQPGTCRTRGKARGLSCGGTSRHLTICRCDRSLSMRQFDVLKLLTVDIPKSASHRKKTSHRRVLSTLLGNEYSVALFKNVPSASRRLESVGLLIDVKVRTLFWQRSKAVGRDSKPAVSQDRTGDSTIEGQATSRRATVERSGQCPVLIPGGHRDRGEK
jgi:hypothetical protein